MADYLETPPSGLLEAVRAYEDALMRDHLSQLDAFFAPGETTLRGDASGLLVGHAAIARFRARRGGTPPREIITTQVRAIDADHALVVTIAAPVRGGRGQQTQLWRRSASGWVIDAAHVSAPSPAIDASVWRLVGTPLVTGASAGPLRGLRVAVKDLFDVAGFAVGGGVPMFLAESRTASAHAPAVAALLDAGAAVVGIARTDEFAYSIAGRNPHYGTPPNPAVIGGIPGGSSNGPASAVALGHADIGLGTDTGGSIRVPASYQGLWGLRTTHGAVSRRGLLPLAASFDTVGWLTRDPRTLRAAASATMMSASPSTHEEASREVPGGEMPGGVSTGPRSDAQPTVSYVVCPELIALAEPEVQAAFAVVAAPHQLIELPDLDALFEGFRTVQAAEAWAAHGAWIDAHPGALGDDIAARFAWASKFTPSEIEAARTFVTDARAELDRLLAGRTLLLPSASSAAPQVTAGAESNKQTRAATLRLTCIAGILGAPALSAPLMRTDAGPVGLCLVGPRGSDLALIDAAVALAAR